MLLKFAIFSKFHQYFFVFFWVKQPLLANETFQASEMGYLREFFRQKRMWTFLMQSWNLLFLILNFSVFSSMENIPISLSLTVSWGLLPSLFRSRFISLSLSLYLFVGAALQLLLSGVMSSSLIFINNKLN